MSRELLGEDSGAGVMRRRRARERQHLLGRPWRRLLLAANSLNRLAAVLAFAITGCNSGRDSMSRFQQSGYEALPDVSRITAYFVSCDSVYDPLGCAGPARQAGTMEFTVAISAQRVLRNGNVHQFHDCEVHQPLESYRCDGENQLVQMRRAGGIPMRWKLLEDEKIIETDRATWERALPERSRTAKEIGEETARDAERLKHDGGRIGG